jgi:uncharacterized protein YjeT (DUF2065 family)
MKLQTWTLLLALLACAAGLPALLAPRATGRALRGFCRHRLTGRVLSTLALVWAGWLLYALPLEFLLPYRKFIPFVMLAVIPFTWFAMPDLLAARALGGLLALLPAPVLQVARVHPSPWRLVIVVLMYGFAVAGMTLIMAPYYLRDGLEWVSRSDGRLRLSGAARLLAGLGLAWLALAVFG